MPQSDLILLLEKLSLCALWSQFHYETLQFGPFRLGVSMDDTFSLSHKDGITSFYTHWDQYTSGLPANGQWQHNTFQSRWPEAGDVDVWYQG